MHDSHLDRIELADTVAPVAKRGRWQMDSLPMCPSRACHKSRVGVMCANAVRSGGEDGILDVIKGDWAMGAGTNSRFM